MASNIHPVKNLEKVPGDAHEAAAQISSRDTPLRAAHNVDTLLVEWPLTPDGRGRSLVPYA